MEDSIPARSSFLGLVKREGRGNECERMERKVRSSTGDIRTFETVHTGAQWYYQYYRKNVRRRLIFNVPVRSTVLNTGQSGSTCRKWTNVPC